MGRNDKYSEQDQKQIRLGEIYFEIHTALYNGGKTKSAVDEALKTGAKEVVVDVMINMPVAMARESEEAYMKVFEDRVRELVMIENPDLKANSAAFNFKFQERRDKIIDSLSQAYGLENPNKSRGVAG